MTGHALLDLLVVLVAAKVAGELSERVRIPAVLGEIAAGIALGPSALGLVESGEFLKVVGEVGVILLLVEVGMEMDLRELARVGRASLLVAVAGMILPFAAGWGALTALGHGGTTAVFLGAALTATSVGITARAFGDMRALASTEARIVIGAAVADDVMGLIVLTVVARIVTGDGIGGIEILSVIGIALGFLVVTTVAGLTVAPKVFAFVHRRASSAGTLVAIAFAFTLAFAELAQAAELAPIVGAFVAGLSLSRSKQAERIGRELAPIGHLFIPVFFLLIGTRAELSALGDPEVLLLAAAMTVVAVLGKVVAGWGAIGTDADRLLIGFGMIPRGEVGLIFATIGKEAGVLDDQLYAALLVVVLLTTILTPPLLRWRHEVVKTQGHADPNRITDRPDGGWLTIEHDTLVLRGTPDPSCGLDVALEAARLAAEAVPGPALLDWFAETSAEPVAWTSNATSGLIELLRSATPMGWRLLDATGVLDRAAPELAEVTSRRRRDLGVLDVTRLHDWPTVERLHELIDDDGHDRSARQQFALGEHPDLVRVAAMLTDVADSTDGGGAERLLDRLNLAPDDRARIADGIADGSTMRSAASHLDGLRPAQVLSLAAHFGNLDRARRAYLLALAAGDLPEPQRDRLDALLGGVEGVLAAHPDGTDGDRSVVERKRSDALELALTPTQSHRIRTAPAALVLDSSAAGLVRTMALLEGGAPPPGFARVEIGSEPVDDDGTWEVSVVGIDSPGFLARVAAGLTVAGLEIRTAAAAAWPDGVALDIFVVTDPTGRPDQERVGRTIRAAIRGPISAPPMPSLDLEFDNSASPWHTLCRVSGPDESGALGAVTSAFAANGINIQTARIETVDGRISDRFAVTDRSDRKLDTATQDRVRSTIRDGISPRGRWRSRRTVRSTTAS